MTAYSYMDWNALSQDAKSERPGISIGRDHPLNNPNRGVYWSGQSSAGALATNIQDVLTGPDRDDAEKMFRRMQQQFRRGVEAPKNIERAMLVRRRDADRALESSSFSLTDEQADQMASAADDVYRIQDQAEILGIDPVRAANAMLNAATANAVGFAPARNAIPELAAYTQSEEGLAAQAQLNQSVGQLYSLIRTGEMDPLDRQGLLDHDSSQAVQNYSYESGFGVNLSEDKDRADEMEMMRGIMGSLPLERNPVPIQDANNFSVRMDTVEEAKVMEVMLRWAGEHEQLPEPEMVHEAFNGWRDSGLVASPFEERENNRVGLIVGSGDQSVELANEIIGGFTADDATQIVVLTSGNSAFEQATEIAGRPVIQGRAVAGSEGVSIPALNDAPAGSVVVMSLTAEEASNPSRRSISANALVGSTNSIAHIAGNNMQAYEAQAIHLAGSMRKLQIAIDSNGDQLGRIEVRGERLPMVDEAGKVMRYPKGTAQKEGSEGEIMYQKDAKGRSIHKKEYINQMVQLREKAREIDKAADPDRYFAAGIARPKQGVTAMAFDGARNYDKAVYRYANGRDPMAEGYARIPKHAAILTIDKSEHAASKWLQENAKERTVLYAEAERNLSFAEQYGAGLEGEKVKSREATTDLTIYDRPRSERTGKPEEIVDWNDAKIRGAVILVSGNATNSAINSSAQETKIAQEAIIDNAHGGIIFDDMQKDFHAAHLTMIALEMGKRFTVVNKEGETIQLEQAREATRKNAQTFMEVADIEIGKRFHGELSGLSVDPADKGRAESGRRNMAYSLSDPVAQMTLAKLPGMSPEKAAGLAKLPLTLEEVFVSKDKAVQEALYANGMPSTTVKNLDVRKDWQKATESALLNNNAAEKLGAQFQAPGSSKLIGEKQSGFIYGEEPQMPIAAFIGNSLPTYDRATGKASSPDDYIDREQLRENLEAMTKKGYAIATTLEEGVGNAVIEELATIPGATAVVATSGNPMAAAPEMRMALMKLMENERTTVVMPTAIAAHQYRDGEGMQAERYADIRPIMHENIAAMSDVAVVVQASSGDQSLHMVDKMIEREKPVVVMLPVKPELAGTEAYRGNVKLARGAGRTEIESVNLATAPGAQGYAELSDENTKYETIDGVTRGNGGTFRSARLARSDMARSGHNYKSIGWNSPARVVTNANGMDRVADAHKAGELKPLGAFQEPSVRELEKASLARNEQFYETERNFKEVAKPFMGHVMEDAARQM